VDFCGDFGLRDTFQDRIALKSIEIDMEKLRMKFSALNVDFNGLYKSRFSRLKETCARGHQRAVPRKSRYFSDVSQSFVKAVANKH